MCTKDPVGYDPYYSQYLRKISNSYGNSQEVSLNYGIGYARGYLVHDRICLDKAAQSCSNNYKMLDVFEAKDLTNVRSAGLVGLSPATDYRNK